MFKQGNTLTVLYPKFTIGKINKAAFFIQMRSLTDIGRDDFIWLAVLKLKGVLYCLFSSVPYFWWQQTGMGLLPDTQNPVLRMRRECRERFPATDFKGNR